MWPASQSWKSGLMSDLNSWFAMYLLQVLLLNVILRPFHRYQLLFSCGMKTSIRYCLEVQKLFEKISLNFTHDWKSAYYVLLFSHDCNWRTVLILLSLVVVEVVISNSSSSSNSRSNINTSSSSSGNSSRSSIISNHAVVVVYVVVIVVAAAVIV